MRDVSGTKHVLRTEIGDIQNLAVTTHGETAWVFYLRTVNVGPTGKRWGTWAVARVNADTREATYLPFPPCGPAGTWGWLAAQDQDVALRTGGRRGGQARTWRGDFSSKRGSEPIRGDFVVIDAKGTLIDRRDPTTWARRAVRSDLEAPRVPVADRRAGSLAARGPADRRAGEARREVARRMGSGSRAPDFRRQAIGPAFDPLPEAGRTRHPARRRFRTPESGGRR